MFMGRDFGTERDYGEEVAGIIDREVKRLVDEQYAYAKRLLMENRDIVDAIVKVLLEKETLDDKEFMDIIDEVKAGRKNGVYHGGAPKLDAVDHDKETALVIQPGSGSDSCVTEPVGSSPLDQNNSSY